MMRTRGEMDKVRQEALELEGWRPDGRRDQPRDAMERELRAFAAGVEAALAWVCGLAPEPFPW